LIWKLLSSSIMFIRFSNSFDVCKSSWYDCSTACLEYKFKFIKAC